MNLDKELLPHMGLKDNDFRLMREDIGDNAPSWAIKLALSLNRNTRKYMININRYLEQMHLNNFESDITFKGINGYQLYHT